MMDVIVPSVKHKGRQEALEDNCIEDQVQSPPREVIKIGPPRGVKRKRQTASERVRLKASSSLPSKETAQGEIEHAVTCTPNESQQHDEGHAWLFLRSPSPVLHSPSGAQQAMGEVETINPNLTLPDLPPTTSTQQADMDSQSQDHSNSDPNIRNLMYALEEKSIEVEAFGRQTLELQLEVTNLKAENVKLSAMSLAADTRYQDQTRALVDAEAHCNSLQQQIADLCRGQAEERLALESSLEKQHTMVRTLQTGKEDAERAQELFREYYNKASAHVTEVDAKNAELEHQLILKSGQVDDGLAMVKEVYEEQLRKTQEELDKWKAFCKVLAEKDRRTDDEVRKRAALEPELRGENERLKQEMDSLRMAYGRFAALQQTTKDYGNGCTQPVSSQDSEEYSQVENGADIIYYVCQFVHGTSICHARFITVEEVREHALHTHFYEVTSEPGYMA
ncbi:hypothetical protein AcW2_000585 [Taiwanofungus camphoratus]|nr:hypothetical protein AcW2_000585 [Antrodia cinnamomea]